ncbi:hypothetical protein [Bifidobacterium cuniculi]|uniref:hypothetical protein n=1 Tax=Bifidobacterium cuniculi TaxID=1688 RepID=UPI000529B514|nr:hypothetical protein [Bifidobacterium cuniculi]
MFDIQQWKQITAKRASIDDECYWEVEDQWKVMAKFLLKNIHDTIQFLNTDCDGDDITWISEVFDQLITRTQSITLMIAIQDAINRHPEADGKYLLTKNLNWAIEDFGDDRLINEWEHESMSRKEHQ